MIQIDVSGGEAPMCIPYMPAGEHMICATINGEPGRRRVYVDEAACARLNADLAAQMEEVRAGLRARPVVFFDHQPGQAAAFPRSFRWEAGRGIVLELEAWSEAGRAAVLGRNYGYVSPAFRLSRSDGQVLGLIGGVEVASLVNDPAFERMAPILDAVAAARAQLPAGVDVVGAAHCNQHAHVPDCERGLSAGAGDFKRAVLDVFAAENKPKKSHIFRVCDYPDVMKEIAPWEGDVIIRWDNLEKLNSKHHLTPEQIATLPDELKKPIAVLEDPERESEFLIVTSIDEPDRQGNIKKAAAVLKLRKDDVGNIEVADIASVYPRDKRDIYKRAINKGMLKYLDKKRAEEWSRLEGDNLPQLLTTSESIPGSEGIVKGAHADVKQNDDATLEEGEKISTGQGVAKECDMGENGEAAREDGGVMTMDKEIKKKLGLAEDADDAAVAAAVAKVLSERDAHKKKADEAEAECKKKDEELKAARAAEKDAWLDGLKKRGVLAPKDEEAVKAASALYDANAAAARVAYGKMSGADDAAIIQAGHVLPGGKGERVEDFINFDL